MTYREELSVKQIQEERKEVKNRMQYMSVSEPKNSGPWICNVSTLRRCPTSASNRKFCEWISFFSFNFLGLVRRSVFGLFYQHRVVENDEYGAVGVMTGRGNLNTGRQPVHQILHYLTWARSRVAAVGSRRLNAWATALSPMWRDEL